MLTHIHKPLFIFVRETSLSAQLVDLPSNRTVIIKTIKLTITIRKVLIIYWYVENRLYLLNNKIAISAHLKLRIQHLVWKKKSNDILLKTNGFFIIIVHEKIIKWKGRTLYSNYIALNLQKKFIITLLHYLLGLEV
jgi:hypothetical protein